MSRRKRILLVVLLIIAVYAVTFLTERRSSGGGGDHGDVYVQIDDAFRAGRSGFMVEVEGVVRRLLPDDQEGSRHQRFVIELPTGQTLLISHNIDLAERLPLSEGDVVSVRGEYEWNDRGGLLHWTHHDPQGRRKGGWIEHDGTRYK